MSQICIKADCWRKNYSREKLSSYTPADMYTFYWQHISLMNSPDCPHRSAICKIINSNKDWYDTLYMAMFYDNTIMDIPHINRQFFKYGEKPFCTCYS
jgi:hypothetical protein